MVFTIQVARALAIDGWMTEPELVWLAQRAQEHKRIVEIGSHLGRSTRALLDNTDGVVYALDNWRGPVEAYYTKEEKGGFYQRFCENVAEHIASRKLTAIRGDHSELGRLFPYKADMVFLDGRHEYEGVKDDILNWQAKITPGGLLCGHDVDFPGVQQAVLEVLGEVEIADGTNIWYTQVKGNYGA